MASGKSIRLSRIFHPKSHRTVIIPLDHAVEGYFPKLEEPLSLISDLLQAGPDAFLLRRGMILRAGDRILGRAAIILRVTSATILRNKMNEQAYTASVEEALRLGVDAVAPNIFVGSDREVQDLNNLGMLADACDEWGMPLMGEVMPIGKNAKPFEGPYEADDVRLAVRTAAEEGCDFIKAYYTGDPTSFTQVIKYSTVPVVIAGGPASDNPEDVFRMVDGALRAGASGISLGRKIWASSRPRTNLDILRRMVHDGLTLEDALREFRSAKP